MAERRKKYKFYVTDDTDIAEEFVNDNSELGYKLFRLQVIGNGAIYIFMELIDDRHQNQYETEV